MNEKKVVNTYGRQFPTHELGYRFNYHKADEDKAKQHEMVRGHLQGMALFFNDQLPDGREKALVMTHLEEAMFWANAAIARSNG